MSEPIDYNRASPTGSVGRDKALEILAIVIHKLGPIHITIADIVAMSAGNANVVKFHERKDGLHLALVTDREALELAKQDRKERGV